jgi:hypothetical protein
MATSLNGFEIEFSAPTFRAFIDDMPNSEPLRSLREQETGEWFFHWREGKLYTIPEVEHTKRRYGQPTDLETSNHLALGLLAARINNRLPSKFPRYEAFQKRPFQFLGQKDELVAKATAGWRQLSVLVECFTIRPKFELDARLYELHDSDTRVGLFMSVGTRWNILASLSDLQRVGIDLKGLHAVRRNPATEERRLVGQIETVQEGKVLFSNSYDGIKEIAETDVWLEGSRASFKRCLSVLLHGRYEEFDKRRQEEEGKLLDGPGIEKLCKTMENVLQKASPIVLAPGLECQILGRILPENTATYKTVVDVGQGDYCFDPSKKKRNRYAWPGLQEFGPFSHDTFSKKSPRILVLIPDKASGKIGQFVGFLNEGITSINNSHYSGGFAKIFHLHNPEFHTVSVPLLGKGIQEVSSHYCEVIESTLRKSSDYDAALVALLDEHAGLEDAMNPYLHAKAMLLTAGIPVQEIRFATATQPVNGLQYIMQNVALSLYAKMGGIPWTVDQGLAVDDEVVIGMGTAEISNSRFEERQRYMGITTVFRGDGSYLLGHLSRECLFEEYPKVLKESTITVLRELKERNGWRAGDTIRIVFHAHKPLKKVEVAEIVKACVAEVGDEQIVEFAFLTVSHEHPFMVIDVDQPGVTSKYNQEVKARYVPPRGRIVQLGRFTRLLCTKGPSLIKRTVSPLPQPVLIHLHPQSTYCDLQYLSEQVLKFTSLSWRSTQPAEDPVTILYSELIARLLARLRNIDGWSNTILNTRLRHNMWFL